MPMPQIAARAHRGLAVALLAALSFTAGCDRASAALQNSGALVGVWDLVSVRTRWPDGRVTEPWGAAPIGRLTYGADGSMITLLMDARRNQADGRPVAAEVQASVAAYYGTYTVDPARQVVTHHVGASLRASEAGSIERRYALNGDTLVLIANALYEGAAVTHTLVWHRAAGPSTRLGRSYLPGRHIVHRRGERVEIRASVESAAAAHRASVSTDGRGVIASLRIDRPVDTPLTLSLENL